MKNIENLSEEMEVINNNNTDSEEPKENTELANNRNKKKHLLVDSVAEWRSQRTELVNVGTVTEFS